MKNKLHTTVCHSEGVTKLWSLSLSKCQILLSSILLILCSLPATAQPYQWQWAINGGSNLLSWAGASWNCYVEQIYDITIDQNNTYYFVASIGSGGIPLLNGQPVTVYGYQHTSA